MNRAAARAIVAILLTASALLAFHLRRAAREDGPRAVELLPPSSLAVISVPSTAFLADRLAPSPLGAWAAGWKTLRAPRHDPREGLPGQAALARRLLIMARRAGGEFFVACTGISISPRLDLEVLMGFDAGSPAAAAAAVAAWSHRCRIEFPEVRAGETEVESVPCEAWHAEGEPPLLVAAFSRWVLASRGERPMREALLHARLPGRRDGASPLARAFAGDARAIVNPSVLAEQLKPLIALQPSLRGQLDHLLPFKALVASLRVRQGVPEETWRWTNSSDAGNATSFVPCRRAALRFAGPATVAGIVAGVNWVAALPVDGMAGPIAPEISGPLAERFRGSVPVSELARLAPHLGTEAGWFVESDSAGAPSFLLAVQARNEAALRERLKANGWKFPAKTIPGQPSLATLGPPPSAWNCGFADGWLLLSGSPDAIARAMAPPPTPDRLDADLRAAMASLPGNAAALGFANSAAFTNLVLPALRSPPGVESTIPPALREKLAALDTPRLAEALRRSGWATASLALDASGGEIRLRGPVTPLSLAALFALQTSP